MLRALQSCLIILSSIILLSTSSYAITSTEFMYDHEDKIVKSCEDFNTERLAIGKDNPFVNFFGVPARYECGLVSFYALHKVIQILMTTEKDSDDWEFLEKLMTKYYIPKYETFNFVLIHLDFERYLEEKSDD